ncbi:MAG TPA: hypothetical protein VH302_07325 [Bryobacteraceae bacterium]|jgi:hypothetical protein|nr:hypothetical protein [Bryobacteraceae bacterium]
MKKNYKRVLTRALGLSLFAAASLSASTTLNAGGDSIGNPGTLTFGGTIVTSLTGSYSATAPLAGIAGTYTETVYADPGNVYCAGCYDFVLTVTASPTSLTNMEGITLGAFTASQVTVGQDASGTACGAAVTTGCYDLLNEVSRTTTGKTVAFGFNGSSNIAEGQNSGTLVVQTNATSFFPGTVSMSDSVSDTEPGFGDLNSAPEPVSTTLLGGGLAFLGILRLRKGRKA